MENTPNIPWTYNESHLNELVFRNTMDAIHPPEIAQKKIEEYRRLNR